MRQGEAVVVVSVGGDGGRVFDVGVVLPEVADGGERERGDVLGGVEGGGYGVGVDAGCVLGTGKWIEILQKSKVTKLLCNGLRDLFLVL